jgi:hypothetical protein
VNVPPYPHTLSSSAYQPIGPAETARPSPYIISTKSNGSLLSVRKL